MEKKLDFLVDMHIQHTEHLQVDSAGAAHMTLETCDATSGSEIRRVFFNYAEAFPHMSYQMPVSKVDPYYSRVRAGGEGAGLVGGGHNPPGHQPPPPHPHQRHPQAAIPTYSERPTVLPISSLQDLSAGPGRTTGGWRADSPLSLLSVNHEELERSPSGFSISGEREGEDGEDLAPGLATGDRSWTRPRPSYLAEGETDTDTDPFTPSGGALPLSSTGEGFGDAVWNTPP